MRIIHIMAWYMPNMGYQENYLPAEQKKLGHDVEIVTSDRYAPFPSYDESIGHVLKNRIVGTGVFYDNEVKIHRLPTLFEISSHGQITLKGLKSKLKELNPDIVQAHGAFSPLTLQVIFYRKKLGYNVFVDDHSHEDNFHLYSVPSKVYIYAVKLFYLIFVSGVVCFMPVTYSSEQILKNILKITNKNIVLFPLGADTNRFKPSFRLRGSLRTDLGLTDNEILMISSGKFYEYKDTHVLIKAFGDISNNNSNVKLLLVGNGPDVYMRKLERLVESLGIRDKVIFNDFVPNKELPKYYNGADIGIWPGNPSITVIEAVATGLPVIVPSSDLAYTLLFKNNVAVGFERENVGDLSEKIHTLVQNGEIRNKMNTCALELTKQELSWKVIATKSIETYKNAI